MLFPGSWHSSCTNRTVILSTQKNSVNSNMSSTRTIFHTFFSFSSLCSHYRRLEYLIQISVHAEYSLKNWIFFEKLSPVNFIPRRITRFFLYFNIWKYIHERQSLCLEAFTVFLSSLFPCLFFKSNSIFFNIQCHQFQFFFYQNCRHVSMMKHASIL